MPKTQKNPIGNEFNANIIQDNLFSLFQWAHEHMYRTTEPTAKEGAVGDIVLVNLSGLTYLYSKFPEPWGWQRAQLIEPTGGWDDIRTPGTSVRLGSSAPGLITFAGSGTLYVPGFLGAGPTEEVFFSIQMPHSWKEGSAIYPHVHWAPADANSGNVKWNLEYTKASVNSPFPATTTLSVVTPTAGVAWQHQPSGFGAIDMTGHTLSTMLHCRLYRNSGDAQDTYAGTAAFLEFDFHYQQDAIGSSEQFVK